MLKKLDEILEQKEYYLSKRFLIENKKKIFLIGALIFITLFSVFYLTSKNDEKTEGQIFSNEEKNSNNEGYEKEREEYIIVDISGAVKTPSVFELPINSRMEDAIKAADGLLEDADVDKINRAEILQDGQKIYIPKKGESNLEKSSAEYGNEKNELVSINTGDSDQLRKVRGIGPAMAEKIIVYRGENGKFKSLEDLKNVEGIGEKTFEKLRPYIKL